MGYAVLCSQEFGAQSHKVVNHFNPTVPGRLGVHVLRHMWGETDIICLGVLNLGNEANKLSDISTSYFTRSRCV
jgi:hypothetical protein